MANPDNPYSAHYILNPVYWPIWLGFGFMRLCILLPFPVISKIAKIISYPGLALMSERRRITRTNICMCFPHYSNSDVRRLMRQNFYSGAMTIFESALSWWGSDDFFKKYSHIEGIEHVEAALKKGKGVLLLGAHYTTLEIGGRVSMQFLKQITPTFKPARNKLFNAMMVSARTRSHGKLLPHQNIRALLKDLKRNEVLWYAPDQDLGRNGSVFAPFMGVQTTTLTATARIAKSSGTTVLPWSCERLPDNKGYKIILGKAFENFPSGNDIDDATTINQSIEHQIKRTPEQYFWGHRRFKTRPQGEAQVYAHRHDKLLRRYRRMLILLFLPILAYTLWIAYRNRDKKYLKQRYGFYPTKALATDLWFHAASVGEVYAVLPLIQDLHKKHPDKKIVLTTFTPTGGAIAQKNLPAGIQHYYLPIDFEFSVRRLLNFLQPKCCIIMETELWPYLHQYCFNRGIPVVIINGRISNKTFKAHSWIRNLSSRSIEFTYKIFARTELDKSRFTNMNAAEDKVTVLGNIKFAIPENESQQAIKLIKPYILVASSHAGEERLIAQLWKKMDMQSHLLVIVPRHPHRNKKIIKEIKSIGLKIAVRSQQHSPDNKTEIYLADTFGELNGFIAGSDFVFMGGTLVDIGGHNILEVGMQHKAVIIGPHMDNFLDERKLYLENDAAIEIQNEIELESTIRDLLQNPDKAALIGQAAYAITRAQQHIMQDYQRVIEEVCLPLSD